MTCLFACRQVNSFVGAFHDAVLLYALAVNETLADNMDPYNGTEIRKRMWGRSFEGIDYTGEIILLLFLVKTSILSLYA